MSVRNQPDLFTKVERLVFRLALVLLLIYEVAKFFKYLVKTW